jgi:hypothetical protein
MGSEHDPLKWRVNRTKKSVEFLDMSEPLTDESINNFTFGTAEETKSLLLGTSKKENRTSVISPFF